MYIIRALLMNITFSVYVCAYVYMYTSMQTRNTRALSFSLKNCYELGITV